MAARRGPHFELSAEHRVKIQNSNILNALIEHAQGDREMSSSQVTAGLGLLRKIMPDLASVDATLMGPDGGAVLFKTIYEATEKS